jgi:rubrerythrin
MGFSLSYAEALAAAVRVEENGALFYRKAAAGAFDPYAAAIFVKLAAMEEEHRGYFKGLAIALEQRESLFLNDPEGKFAASIREMADAGVFDLSADYASFFGGKRSSREAVEFALGIEKDSVIFYLGLQEAVVDREEADKLGGIIKEEMRHISILSGLLKRMKDNQEK